MQTQNALAGFGLFCALLLGPVVGGCHPADDDDVSDDDHDADDDDDDDDTEPLVDLVITGTIGRTDPVPCYVPGQPDASVFTGSLQIGIFDPATDELLGGTAITDIDFTDPAATVAYEIEIPAAVAYTGTYDVGILLDVDLDDQPTSGDLTVDPPPEVDLVAGQDLSYDLVLNRMIP